MSRVVVPVGGEAEKKREHETPALDRWHRELAAERRGIYDFDDLWRAACLESAALGAPGGPLTDDLWKQAAKLLRRVR